MFVERGLLTDEEDIFFLGIQEVLRPTTGNMSAKDIAYQSSSTPQSTTRGTRHKEPPKYLRGWETFDDDRLPDDGQGLRGTAASSGIVTGVRECARSLDEISRVEKGDILITVATDPAWTTVFSIIGGVVIEDGRCRVTRCYDFPRVRHTLRFEYLSAGL